MNKNTSLNQKKERRVRRTRAKVKGTAERPRLAVFRSNRSMTAQLIDDTVGKTLAMASERDVLQEAQGKKKTEH